MMLCDVWRRLLMMLVLAVAIVPNAQAHEEVAATKCLSEEHGAAKAGLTGACESLDLAASAALVRDNDDLHAAAFCVRRASEKLDEAEQSLLLALAARDAAVRELTASPNDPAKQQQVAERSKVAGHVVTKRKKAQLTFEKAHRGEQCMQQHDERLRRWTHGFGVSVSAAGAADTTRRIGGALRYMHRFGRSHGWELNAGMYRLRSRNDAEEGGLFAFGSRINFGFDHVVVFVGAGAGRSAESVFADAKEQFAVSTELGIGFRVGHTLRPEGPCWSLAADTRLFVQPWIPLEPSHPVSVLFGVELGGLFGVGRAAKDGVQQAAEKGD